jgi:hypothetical protein
VDDENEERKQKRVKSEEPIKNLNLVLKNFSFQLFQI